MLEAHAADRTVRPEFKDPGAGVGQVVSYHRGHPLAAIVGTDEETTLLAAAAAAALGLPHNPPEAVRAAGNRRRFPARLADSGLCVTRFSLVPAGDVPARVAVPHLSEPWDCCAEPTPGQLAAI